MARQRRADNPHRSARAVAVALAAALALAGCGGGGDETDTTSPATTSTTSTTPTSEPSKFREQFNDVVIALLTESEDLSPGVARCAIEILDREITDAELEAALAEQAETGEAPAELVDAAFEAGQECASDPGGG